MKNIFTVSPTKLNPGSSGSSGVATAGASAFVPTKRIAPKLICSFVPKIRAGLICLAALLGLARPALALTTNVVFQDFSFTPSSVTIQVGDTIVWTNAGGIHTVTGDGSDPFCGSNAIPVSCSETFTNPGTFPYHCQFHAIFGMRGTVIVMPAVNTNSPPNTNNYVQRNLVSDQPGQADLVDTNLVNPWGLAFSGSSPFWVSDNHTGLSTLYNSTGGVQALVVTIPPPPGAGGISAPTGVIFNGTTNFPVNGKPARFIFATEDGTIAGWNSGTNALLEVDNSAAGAIYKGLTLASNTIYAANFHAGTIDVFDANFAPVVKPGAFVDPNMPTNYAPFNIKVFNGKLYVTYAQQDDTKTDDVAGPGNGYLDVYDLDGALMTRLISNGPLNSPWGMAMAPVTFGAFQGALLVGNFGDGAINAFDPGTGAFLGALENFTGQTIKIEGLWSIEFGNGGQGGDPNVLYFTAGPSKENHGLFGSLAPANGFVQRNLVSDQPGQGDQVDTNLVNPWGLAFSGSSPFWVSDNHTGLSTLYNSTGGVQALVVTIPPPPGSPGISAPTGVIFNGTTNFLANGKPARFIFATEDGTIAGWNSGTNAVLEVDNSAAGAIYKGLTLASNMIYAANFHAGTIDVFDANFAPVVQPGAFVDPNIPTNYAPFNIKGFNDKLYVTYAQQDDTKTDDVAGPGNGYLDVYDLNGGLQTRLISNGPLNSPWGMAMAPVTFGAFEGALLVGNFGDGTVNAFDPGTGTFLGALQDSTGKVIQIDGLWSIEFGNGGQGGDPNVIYFTAGPSHENHGLFGSLSPASYLRIMSVSAKPAGLTLTLVGGTPPYLIQEKTNFADTNWANVLSTTNLTAVLPMTNTSGFFRVTDHFNGTVP